MATRRRKKTSSPSPRQSTEVVSQSSEAPPPLVVSLGLTDKVPPSTIVLLLGWGVTLFLTILVNDFLDEYLGVTEMKPDWYSPKLGWFLLTYLLTIMGLRLYEDGSHILYEMMWACNVGMLVAAAGMLTGRPRMVSGSIAMVGLDQLVWYIDVICYLVLGKFKFGVADYLLWPNTSKIKKITWSAPLPLSSPLTHSLCLPDLTRANTPVSPLLVTSATARIISGSFPSVCTTWAAIFRNGPTDRELSS